jgi:hypothetical protein
MPVGEPAQRAPMMIASYVVGIGFLPVLLVL